MVVKRLDELQPGDTGVVHAIRGGGNVMHRLIDMGLVKGTKISVVKYAPLGDPIEIRLKNFELALRLSEAKTIEVEVN